MDIFYTVVFHYEYEGQKGISPLLQKAGENEDNLFVWKSPEAPLEYLHLHNVNTDSCEVVPLENPVIQNFLKESKESDRIIHIVLRDEK